MSNEPTTEKLAKALEMASCPDWMIKRARDGYYDDFKSELATPITALVTDLMALRTADAFVLAERAKNGEFDGTAEEADAWLATARQDIQGGWPI